MASTPPNTPNQQESSALPASQPSLMVVLKYTAKSNQRVSEASLGQSGPIHTTNQPTNDARRRPERNAKKVQSYSEDDMWEEYNAVLGNDDLLDASKPERQTDELTAAIRHPIVRVQPREQDTSHQENKLPMVSEIHTPSTTKATEDGIKRQKQMVESSNEEVNQSTPIASEDGTRSPSNSLRYRRQMSPTFDHSDIFPILRDVVMPPEPAAYLSSTIESPTRDSDQPRRSQRHKAAIVEAANVTLRPQASPSAQPSKLDTSGFMPSEGNHYQFEYDSPSGRTAAELNELLTIPARPKAFPQDLKGNREFGIAMSYTYLGTKPKPKLAQKAVANMEENDRLRKEQVEEEMQKDDK